MGLVDQAGQAVGGEAIAPVLDGVADDAHLGGDGAVGGAIGGQQDDAGAQGVLLAAGAGADAAFQFGAFGGDQLHRGSMAGHPSAPLLVTQVTTSGA
jgi:hypothetical protein